MKQLQQLVVIRVAVRITRVSRVSHASRLKLLRLGALGLKLFSDWLLCFKLAILLCEGMLPD